MNEKYFLKDEEIISKHNTLSLTNYRVIYLEQNIGKTNFQSIQLDNISFIEISNKSNFNYIILGVILFIFSIVLMNYTPNDKLSYTGIALSIGLFITFFITKKHIFEISSHSGGKIDFITRGVKEYELMAFIVDVEEAILKRKKNL